MTGIQDKKRRLGTIAGAGVVLASLLVVAFQPLTSAQEPTETRNDRDPQTDSNPMCPMMAGVKGIKLTADSPPLLMARADELNLTKQQINDLQAVAKEAQRQATEILTAEQKAMLGESPGEPMSMMEIAMMRSKEMKGDSGGAMCPMCMKNMKDMMQKKTSGNSSQGNDEPQR